MPFVLNVIYSAALVFFSPLLFYRWIRAGKYRDGWSEKFRGKAPLRIGDQPCLWFHAVSVGEVLLLRPLVREMARRRPNWEVVISTTTTTGLAVARRTFPDLVTFYAPLDFSWSTARAVAQIRPTVLALVELELWPNLIRAAKRAGAKVAIINARLSSRSYRGYRSLRAPLQTNARANRCRGRSERANMPGGLSIWEFLADRVSVTGSVKYDGLESDRNNEKTRELRQLLGLAPTDLVFVAGSTMEGEEAAVLGGVSSRAEAASSLRLILVPRHAERFESVAHWLEQQGEAVVRRSQLVESGSEGERRFAVRSS